jgi:4-amino-4-deoxy-L-arabinose transferase-like glycosyltransferase
MPRIGSVAGPLIVTAAGGAMAAATWGTWPDPITDFGKELFIAWQLSLGRRLYVDVAYHLGPLSPYFNALAFKLFGPSLATIEWVNLCLLALMVGLAYRLIRRMAGDLAATVSGITFVCLFAFAHLTPIADYNYVCPYDHAHTHGLLLGLLGLTFADVYTHNRRPWALAAAGLAVGLAFLTRAELFVADAAGVIAVLVIQNWITAKTPRRQGIPRYILGVLASWRSMLFLGAMLVPILVTFLLLGSRAVLGSWPIVLNTSVAGRTFYRDSMGTLDIAASLWRLIRWSVWWMVLFLPWVFVGWPRRNQFLWMALALVWGAGAAFVIRQFQQPPEAFAPLPIALIVCAFLVLRKDRPHRALAIGAIVWAFVLLGKIILNARAYHYGFVLAMPATLVVVAAGMAWTPPLVRAAVAGALGTTLAVYLAYAASLTAQQTYLVGTGRDQFWADERGGVLNDMLMDLQQRATPGQTLAVMPEGAMLNFLARMPDSTPYWSFDPPYAFFAPGRGESAGEAQIAEALTRHPPDWIVRIPLDFGIQFDIGLRISDALQGKYTLVGRIGRSPSEGRGFTMILLRYVGYNKAPSLTRPGEAHAVSGH